ncbi:MAG: ATP-binding cassette domain-containing protein [Bacteroidales bacterium]|nr:ATP-binding cassette domain-containing protein [Bacteroidales bacterium]
MRLFAIVGNLRSSAENATTDFQHTRQIANAFLNQLTNPEKAAHYLQIFEFHFKNLQRKGGKSGEKLLSVFSVKILLIGDQLNDSLNVRQKNFLILQLFDILRNPDNTLAPYALDFLNTFARILNIDPEDYDKMFLFVFGTLSHKARNYSFLIISGEEENRFFRHHVYRENIKGYIVVYHQSRLNQFFFRVENTSEEYTLNAKPIVSERIYELQKGFAIRKPGMQPIHYTDIAKNFLSRINTSDIQLAAIGIEYKYKNSSNGIRKFNFVAYSGELIAIMGGSGVGKSTLLNILNGQQRPDRGSVYINHIDIYKYPDKVKGVIGFIPQDDFLIEELTVFENLLFNARFCFANLNEEELSKKVIQLLKKLSLYEIKDLKVGNPLNQFISGGQRKRLNIALELMREPSILLVDEPTSGLSSSDSEKVMELLKQQTHEGKIVIVNIHQPSSDIFKMFDRLLVLDQGGRPVYYGNTIDSLAYFKNITQHINAEENECIWCGNINPEQILEIVETVKIDANGYETTERVISPDEWYSMYLQNIDKHINVQLYSKPLPKSIFKVPNKWRQFYYFLVRNIKCKIVDTQYLIINILEAPILALVLSFFSKYYSKNQSYLFGENDNIPAFIFMSVVVALFVGMMVSAEEIIRDAKQLKRESFLNLSRGSYIHSKIVYLFTISAFQMLAYVLISHWILSVKGLTGAYWTVLFSTACFANLLGLTLSASLKSVVAIYILIPVLLIPQLLLSGTVIKFDKLHPWLSHHQYVPVIGDMMASRWAYEAIAVSQFKNNRYEQFYYDLEKEESTATYCNNYWIPELLTKVDFCQKTNSVDTLARTLKMIEKESYQLAQTIRITPFKYPECFEVENFNEECVAKISGYLRHARSVSTKILNMAIAKRDNLTEKLTVQLGSHEKLVEFKKKYYNESLAEQLLNKTETYQIIEHHGAFYRKYEPVFYDATSPFGRAHFYAPTKKIGSMSIETLFFNIVAIWLMTLLLYVVLLKDWLKKALKFFERVIFQRVIFFR